MLRKIKKLLRELFFDARVPSYVRRRILEASVRAREDWHKGAVFSAYCSNEEAWRLTAVFCMGYIRGFDEQILEELDCEDPEIQYEATRAAGNWELDSAWSNVAGLVTSADTDKHTRLAAIDAVVAIRPREAPTILCGLTDSDDDDIVDAVLEALAMAEGVSDLDDYAEEDDDMVVH